MSQSHELLTDFNICSLDFSLLHIALTNWSTYIHEQLQNNCYSLMPWSTLGIEGISTKDEFWSKHTLLFEFDAAGFGKTAA